MKKKKNMEESTFVKGTFFKNDITEIFDLWRS